MKAITLKAARVNAGYTQNAAAAALGITRETVRAYEQYRTSPDAQMILKIITLYGRTFDEILWAKVMGPSAQ